MAVIRVEWSVIRVELTVIRVYLIGCAVSCRFWPAQVEDLKRDIETAQADLKRSLADKAAAESEVKELTEQVRIGNLMQTFLSAVVSHVSASVLVRCGLIFAGCFLRRDVSQVCFVISCARFRRPRRKRLRVARVTTQSCSQSPR